MRLKIDDTSYTRKQKCGDILDITGPTRQEYTYINIAKDERCRKRQRKE